MKNKNKKFKLPSMDFSTNKRKNIHFENAENTENVINQMTKDNNIKEIEINDSLIYSTIGNLKAEILKANNINIKLINIKEIDLSGMQFILSMQKSNKNLTLYKEFDDSIKKIIANTGFSKII